MKKVTLFALVALLALSVSGLAIAAPVQGPAPIPGNGYCPYYGQNYNNLTDDQKAQMAAWQQQMLEQKKQMLSSKSSGVGLLKLKPTSKLPGWNSKWPMVLMDTV